MVRGKLLFLFLNISWRLARSLILWETYIILHLMLITPWEEGTIITIILQMRCLRLNMWWGWDRVQSDSFQSSVFNHSAYSLLCIIKVRISESLFRSIVQVRKERGWLRSGASEILEDTMMRSLPQWHQGVDDNDDEVGRSQEPAVQGIGRELAEFSMLSFLARILNIPFRPCPWSSTDLSSYHHLPETWTDVSKSQTFLCRDWEVCHNFFFVHLPRSLKEEV